MLRKFILLGLMLMPVPEMAAKAGIGVWEKAIEQRGGHLDIIDVAGPFLASSFKCNG